MKTSLALGLLVAIALLVSLPLAAQDRTTRSLGLVDNFTFTGYPRFGAEVTPDDDTDLSNPGYVRADESGTVTAACHGNGDPNSLTLTLAAGEFFPCLVVRVYDTNTDAIDLHVFY